MSTPFQLNFYEILMNSSLLPVPAHLLNICSECHSQYIRRFNHRAHAYVAACSTAKTNSHYLQIRNDSRIIARVTACWASPCCLSLLFSHCPLLFSVGGADQLAPPTLTSTCPQLIEAKHIHLLPADHIIPPLRFVVDLQAVAPPVVGRTTQRVLALLA